MMQNGMVKTLIYEKQVRLFYMDNTRLVNEILQLSNGTDKIQKVVLAKTISAVSLMSATLKGSQRISVQITMTNPNYKVFADADANGNVRGYLNEGLRHASSGSMRNVSIENLIGEKGTIRVIKGSAMNQFTGITDMPYRNINDDFSHFFAQSEQTQTFIGTDLIFNEKDEQLLVSQGIFAQLLPGASPHLIGEIKNIYRNNQPFFNSLGKCNESKVEEKLSEFFPDVKYMESSSVQFYCGCSKEMFYGMLYSLEEDEIRQSIKNQESIETGCQICGRTYRFTIHELQALLS